MTTAGPPRRTVLKSAAGLAVAPGLMPAAAQVPARPGDFDFLTGEWRIRHRREKAPGEWDEFEGEATCWSLLNGVAHVEELRIPARDFSGMGLRTLDVANGVWLDFWMNARTGVPAATGTPGRFIDGVGNFDAADVENGEPVIYRGSWDEITGDSHRWRQGVSRDGGQTWTWGWIMQWARR
jgi:hypothetical protein